MNEIATCSPNPNLPAPYQNFSPVEMMRFYSVRQYLQGIDARVMLENCIFAEEKIVEYDGTYREVYSPHYIARTWDTPLYRENKYIPNSSVTKKVYVDTALLMNKLDASLYAWRELNPEVVRLLSQKECVEIGLVSNWVRLIHYFAPPVPQQSSC